MRAWTGEDLARIGAAEEVKIERVLPDGTVRNRVTIWAVRHGDSVYIRSVKGRQGAWFRGIQENPEGRLSAGGVENDVTFQSAGDGMDDEIDAAYRTKYSRYAGRILDSVLTDAARSATLSVTPR